MSTLRIGIVGLGGNCRLRHVPGLRACDNVEITGVVNRRPESTQSVAEEYGIPKTYNHWEDLVVDPEIDAVVIGTWPYLHCPITLAALDAGKHVLVEARMAMNATEAQQMLSASQQHPELVAQIVPSPIGFKVDRVVKEMLGNGFLGQLRELAVIGSFDGLADPDAPLEWRQSATFSGMNMLFLGIVHETVMRWAPDPIHVYAQTHAFTPERTDPVSGQMVPVGTPDSVQVLTVLDGGARGLYHLSGAVRFGPVIQIHLYGSEGTIKYVSQPEDQLLAARRGDESLQEIPIPPDQVYDWRVEQDFVEAIRGQRTVDMTDFATGVRYMEFTEAVARSADAGQAIGLPLM